VTLTARAAPQVVRELSAWEHRTFALHPCIRDLRSAHVLFSGQLVTGIIDYGATGVDHPAADLARLLSDFSVDPRLFTVGLNAYRAGRSTSEVPDAFVEVLARAGAVCSVLGWLIRFFIRHEPAADESAVATRLTVLVDRL
jgi:aminoglycoside phosphotransferase (APT) family kinase protein